MALSTKQQEVLAKLANTMIAEEADIIERNIKILAEVERMQPKVVAEPVIISEEESLLSAVTEGSSTTI